MEQSTKFSTSIHICYSIKFKVKTYLIAVQYDYECDETHSLQDLLC